MRVAWIYLSRRGRFYDESSRHPYATASQPGSKLAGRTGHAMGTTYVTSPSPSCRLGLAWLAWLGIDGDGKEGEQEGSCTYLGELYVM